jgi:hypothetical protein
MPCTSGLGRGCVKILDAAIGAQHGKLGRSPAASFAVSLVRLVAVNQTCAQTPRIKVFTQPRSYQT